MADKLGPMTLQWPSVSLPTSTYYISLYSADIRNSSLGKSRVLRITLNGIDYYRNLTVSSTGTDIFASCWPLSGPTTISLTPAAGSDFGLVINAGEIFDVLLLGGRTATRDVIALEKVKNRLQNSTLDWNGDPCLPCQYS